MNSSKEIKHAAGIIRNGGLVAFPTETVYGLGANALDPVAVARIFELKERPSFDPLIAHVASIEDLSEYSDGVNENVLKLARYFCPGPLTFILPKKSVIPDLVTSGLPTVGMRIPDNPLALELIKRSGCPIAAPSANKFGHLSPTSANHVSKQLPGVDYVLDGGKTKVGIESTIVRVSDQVCEILRPGFITASDIKKILPDVTVSEGGKGGEISSPGMLRSHYSPKKPLFILSEVIDAMPPASGVISHSRRKNYTWAARTIYTSEDENLVEIAAHLFSTLHILEEDPAVDQIFIEPVVEEGLGIAIMDRIYKAAYQYKTK